MERNGDQVDSDCRHDENEADDVCINRGITEADRDVFLTPSLASIEDEEKPGKAKEDAEKKPESARDEPH